MRNSFCACRHYELTDHLGNILATALDKKTGFGSRSFADQYGTYNVYKGFYANLASVTDYYPYGMPMIGRAKEANLIANNSKFGYNGQLRTDEVYGKGNLNTALYWEMDTRIARRWNLDPVDQVSVSNYAVNRLNPNIYSDPLGDYSKAGAKLRNFLNGGNGVSYTQTTGEWGYDKGTKNGVEYRDGLSSAERVSKINAFKQTHFRWNDMWIKNDANGVVKPYTPTTTQKWAESESFVGKTTYSIADGFYLTGQNLFTKNFRKDDIAFHLGGRPSTPNDNMDAFIDVGTSFVPAGEAKYGLGFLKKLNAAQFSKLFKGTRIARMRPSLRGKLNKALNYAVEKIWNDKVPTGGIVTDGIGLLKPDESEQK